MAFQRYPLPTVQKVSQLIRETLVLPEAQAKGATPEEEDSVPDSLDALGDLFRIGDDLEGNLPAPNTEGRWFVSTLDPSEVLSKLPGLWLAPGMRLVTYLRQDPQGGMGATVALPGLHDAAGGGGVDLRGGAGLGVVVDHENLVDHAGRREPLDHGTEGPAACGTAGRSRSSS